MIFVLQIANECGKAVESEDIARAKERAEQLYVKRTDENAYFRVALDKKFIEGGRHTRLRLSPAGQMELDRLLKAKEEAERESERHEREKTKLRLDKIAVTVSLVSLFVSFFALWFSTRDRNNPPSPDSPATNFHRSEEESEKNYEATQSETESHESKGDSDENMHER